LILLTGTCYGESVITGRTGDTSGTAMANCTVALIRCADYSMAADYISDEYGRFVFKDVHAGVYLLKASLLGHEPATSDTIWVEAQDTILLAPLLLRATDNQLKAVTITAQKSMIALKNGVVTLNVANNMQAAGSTVWEMLKLVPGVQTDDQNNVTVNGKSGVRFMIDGRLQRLSGQQVAALLNGMSAERVATIELNKNPSAKYDAEGTAGLINIVTKRSKTHGWNGSVSDAMSLGKRYRNSPALMLNYKGERLAVFSNASYMNIKTKEVFTFNRSVATGAENQGIDQSGQDEHHKAIGNASVGIDYTLSPKTSVAVNGSVAGGKLLPKTDASTTISGDNAIGYSFLKYNTHAGEHYTNPSADVSLVYKPGKEGDQLRYSGGYTTYYNDQTKVSENRFYNDVMTEALPLATFDNAVHRTFRILTQKLDMTKKIGKVDIEAGAKYSNIANKSDVALRITNSAWSGMYGDTLLSYTYSYNEQIVAAYTSASAAWGKIGLQTGLRAEHTKVDGSNDTRSYVLNRSYTNLFPNVAATYSASDAHNMQLSYSYRIMRPDFERLNPIRIVNEQLGYSAGNAALLPEYSHNLSADYSYKGILTASLGYIHSTNLLYSYNYTDTISKVSVDTIFNFPQRDVYSLNVFADKQVKKWYRIQVSAMAAMGIVRGSVNGANANSQSIRFNASLVNDLRLPAKVRLQISGYYLSPFTDGIQHNNPSFSANIMVQRAFGRLMITAGMADIFYSEVTSATSTLPGQSYYYRQKADTRRIKLAASYSFGKTKMRRNIDKSNEEERNRLRKQD
jgi:iron complex outermembrane recepter protein